MTITPPPSPDSRPVDNFSFPDVTSSHNSDEVATESGRTFKLIEDDLPLTPPISPRTSPTPSDTPNSLPKMTATPPDSKGIFARIKGIFFKPNPNQTELANFKKELEHLRGDVPDKLNQIGAFLDELALKIQDFPEHSVERREYIKLEKEAAELILPAMNKIATDIISFQNVISQNNKTKIENEIKSMITGQNVNTKETVISNGLKGNLEKTISLPHQLAADIHRWQISIDGDLLTFDESNPEKAQFQLGKKFIEKVGGEAEAKRFAGFLNQGIFAQLTTELAMGAEERPGLNTLVGQAPLDQLIISPKGTLPPKAQQVNITSTEAGSIIAKFDVLMNCLPNSASSALNKKLPDLFFKLSIETAISKDNEVEHATIFISEIKEGLRGFLNNEQITLNESSA